ncbi:cryptochrome/photolyase family protein [Candidatus Kryptobacter tengchongensis]|uniref:Deoxyribodipyrimidine photo-lyase n=1 Tax=Kryptobacter tengchongensis TaxID=1643429 RepID=A0A656D8P1_KRYT1|nr:deoxyribodipyrimidine photo-lyase [Candidatus Kryptobacter tengchongensis]CUT03727.1 deoxyribodipyrimidine photo-lyase [Candidatus Kryptobacter tengchongensis]
MKVDILWFRRDLRTKDNPLLSLPESYVLPVFIFDKNILGKLPKDDKRITFIFDKVIKLKNNLKSLGLDLAIFYGKPLDVFDLISERYQIRKIFASGDWDSYARERDRQISSKYNLQLVHDNFLIEPNLIYNLQGKPYTVFSHFEKAVSKLIYEHAKLEYKPKETLNLADFEYSKIIKVCETLELLPIDIKSIGFEKQTLTFEGAIKEPKELLDRFEKQVDFYEENRNYPFLNATSLLSVHLRFGTISVREIFRWAIEHDKKGKFISELIWREFFNYILYHYPYSEFENFRKDITVDWREDHKKFEAWKKGLTGFPLVDAGMRQLEQEGYIHNRVRMVVASFLTKNLHIDWRLGEEYFSLKLLDYEASSNIGNWQWNAGVGTDTKIRFFNPFLQSLKFDPNGDYIKRYIPELRKLDPKYLHSQEFFVKEKISGYPKPLVDLKQSISKFKEIYRRKNI